MSIHKVVFRLDADPDGDDPNPALGSGSGLNLNNSGSGFVPKNSTVFDQKKIFLRKKM